MPVVRVMWRRQLIKIWSACGQREILCAEWTMNMYHCKRWSRYRPSVAQRVGRGIAVFFHDRGTRREWVVSSTLRPHFPLGKTRYPLYRRIVAPEGRSGWAENLVPTGIRSRTLQSVAQSLYRLSFRAHMYHCTSLFFRTSCAIKPALLTTRKKSLKMRLKKLG